MILVIGGLFFFYSLQIGRASAKAFVLVGFTLLGLSEFKR
jgi:hypothetical protein